MPDEPTALINANAGEYKPSVIRFVRIEHSVPYRGASQTKATSKLTGSSWYTRHFSLDWVRKLPVCCNCGKDLIDGEVRLCSPCEAAEVMPLIRTFQQDL